MKFAIIVGLPHSGKSIVSKWLRDTEGYIVIDTNNIRKAIVGEELDYIPSDIINQYVKQTAVIMAKYYLQSGQNVLIDDENPTFESRKTWYEVAKECRTRLTVYWINTPASICSKINMMYGSLPEKIMDKKVESFEYPTYFESKMIGWIKVAGCSVKLDELMFAGSFSTLPESLSNKAYPCGVPETYISVKRGKV